MWVRFTDEFWWRVKPQVKIRYRPGSAVNVRRMCGERAIADGKAVAAANPRAKPTTAETGKT
jgi:hypothetical protein